MKRRYVTYIFSDARTILVKSKRLRRRWVCPRSVLFIAVICWDFTPALGVPFADFLRRLTLA